ncbi:DUF4267 domain-containing protein [Egicoccus halophilus]|uniref:DUF4267 domain-containing protein n=1 Tax=Egicoccus halophilus TaxID=1670830 RepID=A0A8J3A725_9ACTN|nr:DUF4267 domain-containing protein [Egicoccus halophilus]GGI05007.1 hypothetical protein GCM10011354_11930 [Egicoccus halophilus]
MDVHFAARCLAATRIGLGLALFLAPERAARGWIGDDAGSNGAATAVRALGARDVALGVGMLAAIGDDHTDLRRWVEAGIVADLADGAATLLGGRTDRTRGLVVVMAASGAAFGGWLRRRLG